MTKIGHPVIDSVTQRHSGFTTQLSSTSLVLHYAVRGECEPVWLNSLRGRGSLHTVLITAFLAPVYGGHGHVAFPPVINEVLNGTHR